MKKNLIYLALALICAGGFLLYLFFQQTRTDAQPPTISFSDEVLELSTLDPKEAFLRGVTADDNVDGDVTDSVVVASVQLSGEDGAINVTYAAFDAAGNVAKATRQARYTDYESPRFSLSTSLAFPANYSFDIFRIVQARDGLDGDISHRVRITSLDEKSITTLGTHQVELKVSNSLGDMVQLVVPVEVYAADTYSATLTLTDYLVYLPLGGRLDPERYLDAYNRVSSTVSLRNGLPEDYTLEIKNNVKPNVPGVYTIEYRVTQTTGTDNSARSYTGYAKLIVVVEG